MDMNALLAKASKKVNENRKTFKPIELTEGNVQAIFDRCLATDKSKQKRAVVLFPVIFGYKREDEILIQFDKDILLENKKNIEYLYGQLDEVHKNGNSHNRTKSKDVKIEDFSLSYKGIKWCSDNGNLLKLLYLGCNPEILLIKPFNKKYNGTEISTGIEPTLSPKDPNFPAWWEEHKADWEEPKKDGQEPADD